MANSDESRVEVNGTNGVTSSVQNDITMALLQNGGFKRLQAILQQRLDEAGWSQDLKDYVTRLLRSGAATTYDDVREIIMANVFSEADTAAENPKGVPAPNLAIPKDAKLDGSAALKKELSQVVEKPEK